MGFYVIVVLTVLNHIAYKGSKMLLSLYAIDLGASPLTIGILYSLYSFFRCFWRYTQGAYPTGWARACPC